MDHWKDNAQENDPPNLIEPKDPIREIWQGRGAKLPRIQKIGVAVALVSFGLFTAFLYVHGLLFNWKSAGLVLLLVYGILAVFFLALTRSVK